MTFWLLTAVIIFIIVTDYCFICWAIIILKRGWGKKVFYFMFTLFISLIVLLLFFAFFIIYLFLCLLACFVKVFVYIFCYKTKFVMLKTNKWYEVVNYFDCLISPIKLEANIDGKQFVLPTSPRVRHCLPLHNITFPPPSLSLKINRQAWKMKKHWDTWFVTPRNRACWGLQVALICINKTNIGERREKSKETRPFWHSNWPLPSANISPARKILAFLYLRAKKCKLPQSRWFVLSLLFPPFLLSRCELLEPGWICE